MKSVLLILSLFIGSAAIACDQHGLSGIVEDNNLWITEDAESAAGITKEEFNKVIDDIEKIYAPIIAEKGKTLQVIRKWDDGTVNAYAQQAGKIWKVSMFGGLARHETITADGFALVVCHELGHHLGGAPKKGGWFGSTWASNEGQSDYWGNLKCMRKYMESQDNDAIIAAMEIPEAAKAACSKSFADAGERAICLRGAMAGLSLGNLFKALRKLTTDLKFDTPDAKVVTKTNHNHPAPQCRLDTYFQGALCVADVNSDVSNSDASTGTCARSASHEDGIRPLCWYKP